MCVRVCVCVCVRVCVCVCVFVCMFVWLCNVVQGSFVSTCSARCYDGYTPASNLASTSYFSAQCTSKTLRAQRRSKTQLRGKRLTYADFKHLSAGYGPKQDLTACGETAKNGEKGCDVDWPTDSLGNRHRPVNVAQRRTIA